MQLLTYSLNVDSCAYLFCNQSTHKRSERRVSAEAHQPPGPLPDGSSWDGERGSRSAGKRCLSPTFTAGHPRGARLRSLHPETQTEVAGLGSGW